MVPRFTENNTTHNGVVNLTFFQTDVKLALAWTSRREENLAAQLGFRLHGVDKCKHEPQLSAWV
jgi:hypothetical protein